MEIFSKAMTLCLTIDRWLINPTEKPLTSLSITAQIKAIKDKRAANDASIHKMVADGTITPEVGKDTKVSRSTPYLSTLPPIQIVRLNESYTLNPTPTSLLIIPETLPTL